MTAELRVIETNIDIDRASVVAVLEKALTEAREGMIRGIALAVVRPDLAINTAWSDSCNVSPLAGAVALLSKRIMDRIDE